VLRPLVLCDCVAEFGGRIHATDRGIAMDRGTARAGAIGKKVPRAAGALTAPQEDLLRTLVRQTAVLEDHVDGRVLRVLLARGLATSANGWVSPTGSAARELAAHGRQERQARVRRADQSPQTARAVALLRALDQLEAAVPRDAELMLRDQPAYADDVLAGLRKFAREMENQ
jgi:hypothetical protein